MNNYLINFHALNWKQPAKGARYKEYCEGSQKIRLVEFTDELIEKDWCTKGHVGYVLDGKMSVDFNGRILNFKKGDGIIISEGDDNKHKAIIPKGEKVLLIMFEKA